MRKFDMNNLTCFFVGMGVGIVFAIVTCMGWHAFRYLHDYAPPVASIRFSDDAIMVDGGFFGICNRDCISRDVDGYLYQEVKPVCSMFGEEALRNAMRKDILSERQ